MRIEYVLFCSGMYIGQQFDQSIKECIDSVNRKVGTFSSLLQGNNALVTTHVTACMLL